ncbi:sugar lactone lactonase YvrE [Cupriavidus alkaliphilus]|nr:SMP-30/gluconolactonase/LRE family protein [Cupriavidus alkaliphilus]MBB3014066.1 sugar lactone lactonase YvrE [Cupriavidus alkaliphilus]
MAAANGVALSPDGKVLWATEFCTGRLHRMNLHDAVTATRFGTSTPYHFIARASDSMGADADDGNVYVAMYDQGHDLPRQGPCVWRDAEVAPLKPSTSQIEPG